MENLQISTLSPELASQQNELNIYVAKAENFKAELSKIEKVTDENYDIAKKLRQEITSQKVEVENVRLALKRPLLRLWEAIDERAKLLSAPFETMKKEIQEKIWTYEAAENERKEAEAKRVQGIIEEMQKIEVLEELEKFYKSLDTNDQRKKAIAETGVLQKEKIQKIAREKEVLAKRVEIEQNSEVEALEKIDLTWYEELRPELEAKINKIKISQLEAEKIEREKKEFQEKQEREAKEKAEREEREAKERKDAEERKKQLYDMEKNMLDLMIGQMEKIQDLKEMHDFVCENMPKLKNIDLIDKFSAIYTAQKKGIIEKNSAEQEKEIQDFLKKDRGDGEFHTKRTDREVKVYKLVDTLMLK